MNYSLMHPEAAHQRDALEASYQLQERCGVPDVDMGFANYLLKLRMCMLEGAFWGKHSAWWHTVYKAYSLQAWRTDPSGFARFARKNEVIDIGKRLPDRRL